METRITHLLYKDSWETDRAVLLVLHCPSCPSLSFLSFTVLYCPSCHLTALLVLHCPSCLSLSFVSFTVLLVPVLVSRLDPQASSRKDMGVTRTEKCNPNYPIPHVPYLLCIKLLDTNRVYLDVVFQQSPTVRLTRIHGGVYYQASVTALEH